MGGQLRDRKREARLPLGSRAPLASCAEGRRVRNAAALTYTTTSSYEQMLEEKGGGCGTDGNLRSVSVVLSPGDASDTA